MFTRTRLRRIARHGLWALLLPCAACASTTAPGATTTAQASAARVSASPQGEPMSAAASRVLDAHATFADLVRLGNALDARNRDSQAGCVLARDGSGFRLAADWMPALDRAPDAPFELASRLDDAPDGLSVLTAWGVAGTGDSALVASSLSATPALRDEDSFALLVLDAAGAHLRYASAPLRESDEPLAVDVASRRIATRLAAPSSVLFVTADATLPVERLYEALASLPPQLHVALAVVLPPTTRLPATSAPAAYARCPDGLPEPDGDAAFGELDRTALEPLRATLSDGATHCVEHMRGPATRVVLGVRIDGLGAVAHACMVDAAAVDPATAACLLAKARDAHVQAPSPAGLVDVHVPLTLTPTGLGVQRAVCER